MMQDNNIMYKILSTIFRGSTWAWYYSLKPGFILCFSNLYSKLIAHFNMSIHGKKKVHLIYTRAYLKKLNEEMLKIEDLFELVTTEAQIG